MMLLNKKIDAATEKKEKWRVESEEWRVISIFLSLSTLHSLLSTKKIIFQQVSDWYFRRLYNYFLL